MKILIFMFTSVFAVSAFASNHTVYTSVKADDCMQIDGSNLLEDPEIDFYEAECAGLGGYQVVISGGDLRYDLKLSYRGQNIKTKQIGAFHDMGSNQIEWRFKRTRKGFSHTAKLIALTYRLNYETVDQNTGKVKAESLLVVMRLNKGQSCIVGEVGKQAKQSEKALAIADDLSAPCL